MHWCIYAALGGGGEGLIISSCTTRNVRKVDGMPAANEIVQDNSFILSQRDWQGDQGGSRKWILCQLIASDFTVMVGMFVVKWIL